MGGRFSKRPFKFSMWRCRGGDIGKRKERGGIGRKGSGGGSVPKGGPFLPWGGRYCRMSFEGRGWFFVYVLGMVLEKKSSVMGCGCFISTG